LSVPVVLGRDYWREFSADRRNGRGGRKLPFQGAANPTSLASRRICELRAPPIWPAWLGRRRMRINVRDDIFKRPELVGDASGHCGRDAKRFVDADEIVKHGVERDHVDVPDKALAEAGGEPREAAVVHAQAQIAALYVTRGDVRRVGIALHLAALRT